MRRFPVFLAAFGAALLVAALASAPAAAEVTKAQGAEADALRDGSRLIGYTLAAAAYARFRGDCRWREAHLAWARDEFEFHRRFHRRLPDDPRVTDEQLDNAERMLRIESRRPCTLRADYAAAETAYAELPPLTGTAEPMPSQLPDGASMEERHFEVSRALDAIYVDTDRCRIDLVRRWLENYRQMLSQLYRERELALAAGEFSSIDPQQKMRQIIVLRSIVRGAEERFRSYRVNCARRDAALPQGGGIEEPRSEEPGSAEPGSEEGVEQADGPRRCVPPGDSDRCEEPPPEPRCAEGSEDVEGCGYFPPFPRCIEGTEPWCDAVPSCLEGGSAACDRLMRMRCRDARECDLFSDPGYRGPQCDPRREDCGELQGPRPGCEEGYGAYGGCEGVPGGGPYRDGPDGPVPPYGRQWDELQRDCKRGYGAYGGCGGLIPEAPRCREGLGPDGGCLEDERLMPPGYPPPEDGPQPPGCEAPADCTGPDY